MATALAVTSVVLGVSESRKARKEQKKGRRIQQKQAKLSASRQAIEQVRQAQIARAQVISQAESTGVGGSSAVAGAAGSIQSQAGANITFAQELFRLSQQATRRLNKADQHSASASGFSQLAQVFASFDTTPPPAQASTNPVGGSNIMFGG